MKIFFIGSIIVIFPLLINCKVFNRHHHHHRYKRQTISDKSDQGYSCVPRVKCYEVCDEDEKSVANLECDSDIDDVCCKVTAIDVCGISTPVLLQVFHETKYICGASLIHPKVALTAAECRSYEYNQFKVGATEVIKINNRISEEHKEREVSYWIIHEKFDSTTLMNNIALLVLKSPFELTENFGVICIPRPGTVIPTENFNNIVTVRGKYSIQRNQISLLTKRQCAQRKMAYQMLDKLGFFPGHESLMFVDDDEEKKETDRGSPLYYRIGEKNHKYEQIGIFLWGLAYPISTSLYVSVVHFSAWIDDHLRESLHIDMNTYYNS